MCNILFLVRPGAVSELCLHKSSVINLYVDVITLKKASVLKQCSRGIMINQFNEWKDSTRPCPMETITQMCNLNQFFDVGTSNSYRVLHQSQYLPSVSLFSIKSTFLSIPVKYI